MSYCRFKDQEREELHLLGPPHPGEIARDDALPHLELTRKEIAEAIGVSISTVSKFLNGRRRASPKIAAGLARLTGTTPLYWLVLQAHHDAWLLSKPGESSGRAPARSTAYTRAARTPKVRAFEPA
jgi:addiction module HigA family antidote